MIYFDNPDYKDIKEFIADPVTKPDIVCTVAGIINQVKEHGDKALVDLTLKYDSVDLSNDSLLVGKSELKESINKISPELLNSLELAKKSIIRYHEHQKRQNWQFEVGYGSSIREVSSPVDRVGIYIPGGTAPLVSSVLMTALPAKVAEVDEVIVVTPPQKDGKINTGILAACAICGIDSVYKIGGAQAIAALALGTESVPKVDIIAGPGNPYVTEAKRQLYGTVGLDMIAGPSEVLILADESTNKEFAAVDLLSQVEHGKDSKGICISQSKKFLNELEEEILKISEGLSRKEILNESIDKGIALIKVNSAKQMMELVNYIGPEHLEVMLKDTKNVVDKIKNAGVVFLGEYTPEAVGDYIAGPSHVLPTGGRARFFYGLSIYHFLKKISFISYTKEKLQSVAEHISNIAICEGLDAHSKSVTIRCKE